MQHRRVEFELAGVVLGGDHAVLVVDRAQPGRARGLHHRRVRQPRGIEHRRRVAAGIGLDVAGGQRGAHRVVADVLEQPAHRLRPPRGRKVGFGGDPVGAIRQLIEHRSECFDQYGLEVGGRPALALGDARRELLHHEQPETVVVAREPVEVVADLGQRARQAVRNPAARIGRAAGEYDLGGWYVSHDR